MEIAQRSPTGMRESKHSSGGPVSRRVYCGRVVSSEASQAELWMTCFVSFVMRHALWL